MQAERIVRVACMPRGLNRHGLASQRRIMTTAISNKRGFTRLELILRTDNWGGLTWFHRTIALQSIAKIPQSRIAYASRGV